ncbi:YitT family protein [Thermoactinomyces sp. DSM 45891]|uniref:YitT family protein n=1 Tax=Thermoactinomyces sp. DSM 45891 TaxID=1761907 RepID=UPI0009F4FCD9|nr:YitT family protein [Thermoactinomyces sp. DSM 45891]
MILFGSMLVAVGLEIFLLPNQVIDGGIVGISMMLAYLTGLKLGVFLFVLNLPFFFLGYKQIGKTFAFSTMLGVAVMSIGTYSLHSVPPLTNDPLLASIFGGIIVGIGVGLVIRYGGSLDGTEILAILFNKTTSFSVGQIVLFFNLFILGSAGFLFGWERAMYSFIAYFIVFKLLDVVIEGFDETKFVWIMSEEPEKLGSCILNRLGRGVTYLSGEGGYTGEYKKVIFCVITRLEEAKLKEIVEDIDPQAFFAVGNIHEVRGGHFKKRSVH